MMVCELQTKDKKTWSTPALTVYGNVEELTQAQYKTKQPGSRDDFNVNGISDFP